MKTNTQPRSAHRRDFSLKRLAQAIVIALGAASLGLACPIVLAADALLQQGDVISGAAKISQYGKTLHIETLGRVPVSTGRNFPSDGTTKFTSSNPTAFQ